MSKGEGDGSTCAVVNQLFRLGRLLLLPKYRCQHKKIFYIDHQPVKHKAFNFALVQVFIFLRSLISIKIETRNEFDLYNNCTYPFKHILSSTCFALCFVFVLRSNVCVVPPTFGSVTWVRRVPCQTTSSSRCPTGSSSRTNHSRSSI